MALLKEGDIIELKEGHEVYGPVRMCDAYTNKSGDESLTEHEVKIGGRYSHLAGRYLVYKTKLMGGGRGHGPHDIYPDGHRVYCRKISDGTEVNFYQTGAFTAMIEDIDPIDVAEGLLVSELEGEALDWAVAKAIGDEDVRLHDGLAEDRDGRPVEYFVIIDCEDYAETPFKWVEAYSPSTNWSQGGPLIEENDIAVMPFYDEEQNWEAAVEGTAGRSCSTFGRTPLEAICRAVVLDKLGEPVEVPQALLKATAPTNPGA